MVWRLLPALGAMAMCAFVFWHGSRSTRDLNWPHDQDLYRDLSQAQTIADGRFGDDPFYRGETLWYNPLAPWVVARLGPLLDLPLGVAYSRLGAYLNLLGPVLFFLLVRRLWGAWVALAALSSLLFLRDPEAPSYTAATYSPWLLSAHLAQPLFYGGILALRAALVRGGRPAYLLTGLLLGLVFLAHTGPAIILGVMALVLIPFATRRPDQRRWTLAIRRLGLVVGVAATVGLPLLVSIVGHYGLRLRNLEPLNWNWPPFDAENALTLLNDNLGPGQLIAGLGLAAAMYRMRKRTDARLVVAWALACAGLLVYSWLAASARLRGVFLPNLVPAFHFVFWGKAAESALFGYGLRHLALFSFPVAMRAVRQAALSPRLHLRGVEAVLALCVVGVVVHSAPTYSERADLVGSRHRARKFASFPGSDAARQWLRENTTVDDVILATDDMALLIVGPSGRKVVALGPIFSNPYVRWDTRHAAREAMFYSLEAGQEARFRELAREYGVTYVISGVPGANPYSWGRGNRLRPDFNRGYIRIFRVP